MEPGAFRRHWGYVGVSWNVSGFWASGLLCTLQSFWGLGLSAGEFAVVFMLGFSVKCVFGGS